MRRPIRLGIIGLGAMGGETLRVASLHEDYRVTLCADISPDSLALAQSSHPEVSFTSSPRAVIESEDVDAIYIATPPAFHAEYAIAALQRHKPVFCEKPLVVSLEEGEAMAEAAHRTGVVNAVNFALADRHAVLEIERALEAGEIGDIQGVEVRQLFPEWPREFQAGAAWLAGRRQGGFLREVFSHFAYLTDRILGPLTPAFVRVTHAPEPADGSETAAYGLFHAGHVPVEVTGRAHAAVPETYEWNLYGSRRSYSLRNWDQLFISDGAAWSSVPLSGPRGSEHTRLTAFARAMRGESHNLPDFATGLRVARLVESFHQDAVSFQSGLEIALPAYESTDEADQKIRSPHPPENG